MKTSFLRVFALLMTALAFLTANADDIKTIEGEYTLHGDGRLSPADCRRIAAENARVAALAKEFGTIVSQDLISSEKQNGDESGVHFLALSSSEVKGEWLGDIQEPKYDMQLDAEGNLIVTCHVKGRAKPISNNSVNFEASVLRNGTNVERNADTNFRSGDYLYLHFSAPVDGYVNAYLADESGEVYCILPYSTGDVTEIKTKKNYDYIFFDPKRGTDFGIVDEIYPTAPNGEEYNKVYVVFSPNPFTPAPVKFKQQYIPPSMSYDDFSKWLIKCRRNDPRMSVKSMNIVVSPK